MRNTILFVIFLLYSPIVFCQSIYPTEIPLWDSIDMEGLKDIGFYFNKIDLVENRIDTLYSDSVFIRTLDDNRIIEKSDNFITFYEYDNLLVLNSDSNIDKKFMFLNFLYEEGTLFFSSKHYSSENGDRVIIEYKIKNHSEKKIAYISIYSNKKNDYFLTYFD